MPPRPRPTKARFESVCNCGRDICQWIGDEDRRQLRRSRFKPDGDCDRSSTVYIAAKSSSLEKMSPIALLLNLLWIVFGGLWMAVAWVVAAVIMAITIIGIPWARAAFNIGSYTLLPFGRKAVSRAEYSGQHDLGTGPFGLLGNIIWLVLAGWWLRSEERRVGKEGRSG